MSKPIPEWDVSGLLPAIRPGGDSTDLDRSPYECDLSGIADRFATNEERIRLFRGFLDYRGALHQNGFCKGFQWLNGSYMEDKEGQLGYPPKDIDVVTFYEMPHGMSASNVSLEIRELFTPEFTKSQFGVDATTIRLETGADFVRKVTYWYSMWGHSRDSQWKGFVEASLESDGDEAARGLLNELEKENTHGA